MGEILIRFTEDEISVVVIEYLFNPKKSMVLSFGT
jgi:hypothetical protein